MPAPEIVQHGTTTLEWFIGGGFGAVFLTQILGFGANLSGLKDIRKQLEQMNGRVRSHAKHIAAIEGACKARHGESGKD